MASSRSFLKVFACCSFRLEDLIWPLRVAASQTKPSEGLPAAAQRFSNMALARGCCLSRNVRQRAVPVARPEKDMNSGQRLARTTSWP